MAFGVYALLFLVLACDLGYLHYLVTPHDSYYLTGQRRSVLQRFRDEALKRWLSVGREMEEEKHPDFGLLQLDVDDDFVPPMNKRLRRNKYAFGFIPNVYYPRGRMPYRPPKAKSHRLYDVPQTECPGGEEMLACPSSDERGRYKCIDDRSLCDGFWDCPNGDDEDQYACMFYKTSRKQMDFIANAVLRWVREA